MPSRPVFTAEPGGRIAYHGNRIFGPIDDIRQYPTPSSLFAEAKHVAASRERLRHLARIDGQIFVSAVDHLANTLGALWANVPLTTKMVSSPGAVYKGQPLHYTTDTLPIEIPSWFDSGQGVFLSESCQLYLELLIAGADVSQVFTIANSFRRERSDFAHLAEFQHIEYEGRVSLEEMKRVAIGLVDRTMSDLVTRCSESLRYFVDDEHLDEIAQGLSARLTFMTFAEALEILSEATGDRRYLEHSLAHFGTWEEIKLTNLVGSHVYVHGYPLLQIPFYHARYGDGPHGAVAKNADFIFSGYREVIGSGERIADKETLFAKADFFGLPRGDYEPYLVSRDIEGYVVTSGFGLGWQRLVQWLLRMPTIVDATLLPRTHELPRP